MQPLTVLLMGPQGSGKGTQLELLRAFLEQKTKAPVLCFESGKEFRSFTQGERFTHRCVRESLERGERQPEFLATLLLGSFLVNHASAGEHLIIDGFPRTVLQAEVLDSAVTFYKRSPVHVVVLDINDSEAVRRLVKRGRHDDTDEGILERLRWYRAGVSPIIDHYQNKPGYIVSRVNGDQPAAGVHRAILAALCLDNA